jgi:thiol-disulfide isomerase/thioredoxin
MTPTRILGALALLCLGCPAQATGVGEQAPDFAAPTLQGAQELRLSDYHGRVVYLDFWASWCAPCRVALPLLEELRHEFGARGFEVIAVDVDENRADGEKALRGVTITYPVLRDPQGQVATLYALPAMPSSYLIGRDGAVRAVHQGLKPAEMAQRRAAIESLLGEK